MTNFYDEIAEAIFDATCDGDGRAQPDGLVRNLAKHGLKIVQDTPAAWRVRNPEEHNLYVLYNAAEGNYAKSDAAEFGFEVEPLYAAS